MHYKTYRGYKFNAMRTLNALRDMVIDLGGELKSTNPNYKIRAELCKNEYEKYIPTQMMATDMRIEFVHESAYYFVYLPDNPFENAYYAKSLVINGRVLQSESKILDSFWIKPNEHEYLTKSECVENAVALFTLLQYKESSCIGGRNTSYELYDVEYSK